MLLCPPGALLKGGNVSQDEVRHFDRWYQPGLPVADSIEQRRSLGGRVPGTRPAGAHLVRPALGIGMKRTPAFLLPLAWLMLLVALSACAPAATPSIIQTPAPAAETTQGIVTPTPAATPSIVQTPGPAIEATQEIVTPTSALEPRRVKLK